MMRYFLRLSFIGTNFYGTQKQKKDLTIQGLFESLLERFYCHPVKVIIASRLDRGVHALDFALAFDIEETNRPTDRLFYYLKRSVPKDIFLKELRIVPDDFSPRYDCADKQYLYLIQNGENKNPLYNPFSYSPNHILDTNKMKETLFMMKGIHEFMYFSSPDEEDKTFLDIEDVSFHVDEKGLIQIRFRAKSFLRYQIRFMVGAAISVALDKISMEDVQNALDGKKELRIKYKAEPQGLILEEIHYPQIPDEKKISFQI